MMHRAFLISTMVLSSMASPALAQVFFSEQNLFDESTGFIQASVGGSWFRGSGVITRDSRLIYSCGHVFYDNGVWATRYRFHRAYHSSRSPSQSGGAAPRGFRYFTNYATNERQYGSEAGRTYAYDFTVLYGDSSFGPAVGWWTDGGAVLRSDRWKTVAGYPSDVEYTGANGYAYQHWTDWFSVRGDQVHGVYHHFDDVSTGPGNSGGPVFVWDTGNDDYYLAGILVSGGPRLAGVYALGDSSHTMASNALGLEPSTRAFRNTKSFRIPDGKKRYSGRAVKVSGFSDSVKRLKFSTLIKTPRSGDLDVYLRSPTGRIRWISKKSKSRANDLVKNNANLSSSFRGVTANGKWQLKMRDRVKKRRATFERFVLKVTALAEE